MSDSATSEERFSALIDDFVRRHRLESGNGDAASFSYDEFALDKMPPERVKEAGSCLEGQLPDTMRKKPDNVQVPENYPRLEGSERKPATGARRVGPADPQEQLSVMIYVRRSPDGPPMPDHEYWARTPPGQRTFVSQDQFAQLYGAAPEDLNNVMAFAQTHGLTVVEINPEARFVIVSGAIAQMNDAFKVDLGRYESPREKYRGREGHIQLPQELAGVVQSVLGLDNRSVARHMGVGGPPGAVALTPLQVANAYGFPMPLDATGQTIGILELGGGYLQSDIKAYLQELGVSMPTIIDMPVTGNSLSGNRDNPSDLDLEVALDISVAAAIAQGAEIWVYFGGGTEADMNVLFSAAINPGAGKKVPTVITASWGIPEGPNLTTMAVSNVHQTIADAAAKGITVFVASGDEGSDCEMGDNSAHVSYPTSDPGVTGCGGTYTIVGQVSLGTWNDPPGDYGSGATGGGVSDFVFPPEPARPA